jgi:hypothetical protein
VSAMQNGQFWLSIRGSGALLPPAQIDWAYCAAGVVFIIVGHFLLLSREAPRQAPSVATPRGSRSWMPGNRRESRWNARQEPSPYIARPGERTGGAR